MPAADRKRPPGFPAQQTLVLTETDVDNRTPLVLGVFRSYEELEAAVSERLVDGQCSFGSLDCTPADGIDALFPFNWQPSSG